MQKALPQIRECSYYVDGMHCSSCEILIERKLLKQDGVKSADASLREGRVDFRYEAGRLPDLNDLNKEFAELGYKFSQKKFRQNQSPLISFKDGELKLNPVKARSFVNALFIAIALIVTFFIFEKLQFGQYVSVNSSSSLPAFLTLGIVAGFSSCAALVGGILLSLIKQWNEAYIDSENDLVKATPHIQFHIGRLISFFVLGGLLGLLGNAVSLQNPVYYSVLVVFASIIMLILSLQMLGVEWALRLQLHAPKFIGSFSASEQNQQGKFMPFIIGVITFFLPCGFTLIAQSIALTSGSFLQGGLIMLFFALGTFIPLGAISLGGLKFNKKPHLTAKFNLAAGLVIIFFVLYNLNSQMNVLGLPSLSDLKIDFNPVEQRVATTNNSGEQKLGIIAKGFEYIPTTTTTLQAGVPTEFIIDNQGIDGCGAYLSARGLLDGFVELKPGITKLSFTPIKGTYKITCSMGMVPPVTIKVV